MNQDIYLFSTSTHKDAISINPLDIKFFKPRINFLDYDYLILTSKQAVKALSQYKQKDYANSQALCISLQTAKSFESIRGKVLEIGEGYGDDLSVIIQKYPKKTKWLYLRAQEVASNFVVICKNLDYEIQEKIIYKSSCSDELKSVNVQSHDTLIFTSPSAVKCFSKENRILQTHTVIVIGETTQKALEKNINSKVAQDKTIQSCIDLALNHKTEN